jgi:uncharacterized membrane-anchored protein
LLAVLLSLAALISISNSYSSNSSSSSSAEQQQQQQQQQQHQATATATAAALAAATATGNRQQATNSMPIFYEFLAGGIANSITSTIVHPMDVTKTRMQFEQLQAKAGTGAGLYRTAVLLKQEAGWSGFFRLGLQASIMREMSSSGIRAGK